MDAQLITADEFDKDIEKEKAFLKELSNCEINKISEEIGITNELAIMIKIYNERLNNLVALRYDRAIFNYLIIAEPMDKTHLDNKTKADNALAKNRKIINVMREQIVKMVEGLAKK